MKPKKSVWLNTDDDNEETLKKVEKKLKKLKTLSLYKKLRRKMLRKRLLIMRSLSHFPKRKIT